MVHEGSWTLNCHEHGGIKHACVLRLEMQLEIQRRDAKGEACWTEPHAYEIQLEGHWRSVVLTRRDDPTMIVTLTNRCIPGETG